MTCGRRLSPSGWCGRPGRVVRAVPGGPLSAGEAAHELAQLLGEPVPGEVLLDSQQPGAGVARGDLGPLLWELAPGAPGGERGGGGGGPAGEDRAGAERGERGDGGDPRAGDLEVCGGADDVEP